MSTYRLHRSGIYISSSHEWMMSQILEFIWVCVSYKMQGTTTCHTKCFTCCEIHTQGNEHYSQEFELVLVNDVQGPSSIYSGIEICTSKKEYEVCICYFILSKFSKHQLFMHEERDVVKLLKHES